MHMASFMTGPPGAFEDFNNQIQKKYNKVHHKKRATWHGPPGYEKWWEGNSVAF